MMKVTFLGTGTSMGVPVAGGFGRELLGGDPRNIRTRCSVWIETEKTSILIDAGPEFRVQSIRSGLKKIDLLLITHEHMDHIAGLDDLRSYNYVQKGSIPLYSTNQALNSIRTRFDYMFGENKYPGSTSLDLREATAEFDFEDVTVTPLPIRHGSMEILGFRINNFAYITDVKSIPEETLPSLKGIKTLVLGGLRWEPKHPTHLTIPESADLAQKINAEKTYLVHMNSYVNHVESNNRLPENVQLAYDQLEIFVE